VLKAWTKVFPNIVKPISQIDGQLMSHVRYPEDLFKVQRTLLQSYHVTDPSAFYGGQTSGPSRRPDPGRYPAPAAVLPDTSDARQKDTSFSLSSTFVPTGRTRSVLTGFLAVDSDAGSTPGVPRTGYGQLRLPAVAPGHRDLRAGTGAERLQLRSGGVPGAEPAGTVEYPGRAGNLLTLPLAALAVRATGVRAKFRDELVSAVAEGAGGLRRQDRFENTLDGALDKVFGSTGNTTTPNPGSTTGTVPRRAPERRPPPRRSSSSAPGAWPRSRRVIPP